MGAKVGIQEHGVRELVFRVFVHVGDHVAVDVEQRRLIIGIADRELAVLLPKVGLENFGGREKPQHRRIAVCFFGGSASPLGVNEVGHGKEGRAR